jgi:hypothetical protein
MAEATSRLFQVRLSDALLIAIVPAASMMVIQALHLVYLSPEITYVIAVVTVIPGAVVGIFLSNSRRLPSSSRTGHVLCLSLLSVGAGIAVAQPLLQSYHRKSMRQNEVTSWIALKTFAEAEEIYRRTDYDGDGVLEYAPSLAELDRRLQKQSSSSGFSSKFVAAEGLPGVATPLNGYVFKVLTAQGSSATGGKRNYMVNGDMTMGYAMIACPAIYGETGSESYVISNNGSLFGKDLGPDTAKIMEQTTEFNPDTTWYG